jgi:hypothetical protein
MKENNPPQFYKRAPRLPHLLKIKASGVIARCIALNEKTQEYDVEDSDGIQSTIPCSTASDIVTPQEEAEFFRKNPDKN